MPSRGVMFCGCSASTRSMLGERQRMIDGGRLKTTMQPAASTAANIHCGLWWGA